MRGGRLHWGAAFLAVAAFSARASAEIPIPSAPPALAPISLNVSVGDQYDPHVSGDLAAYTSDLEIRYFDFATSFDAAIPLDASARDLLSGVSGTRIVFSRVTTGIATAIALFDTATGNTVEIDSVPSTTRIGSAIGGNTVAYIDYGLNGFGEIVARDLAGGVSRRLTTDSAYDANPSVSATGAVITWEHCATSTSNCDIRQATRNGAEWVVSTVAGSASPEANPDSDGALVVYDSPRVGESDIYWKAVVGGPEGRLEFPGYDFNPSIADGKILFESRPTLFDTTDLYVYDTISRRLFRLTDTPLVTEQLCDIDQLPDGRFRVVWSSDEDGFDQRNVHAVTFELPVEEFAWGWGSNQAGQVGDGTQADRAIPARIAGLTVVALAGGREHSLALLSDGTVWAWGRNNAGQLGDGGTADRSTPGQVTGLGGVVAIAAGDDHNVALTGTGAVWTWGSNSHGQLGAGTGGDSALPAYVYRLADPVVAIAAGGAHSLAVTRHVDPSCPPIQLCVVTEVFAWGDGRAGQLGDGLALSSELPVKVAGLSGVAAVAAGSAHSLALKLNGALFAWGLNDSGQLGDGTNASSPVPVAVSGFPATAIAARGNHSLAVTPTIPPCQFFPCPTVNRVSAWGANGAGQLGDSTTLDSDLPLLVPGLVDVAAIAAGGGFSLATRSDGSLWTWGSNASGQLGDGTQLGRSAPAQIVLQRVAALGAGANHSLASGRRAECSDGLDNDGDGRTDYASNPSLRDYGCGGLTDATETGAAVCDDGTDNDGDGRADYRALPGVGDLGCSSHRSGLENPHCQDGIDNDLALGIDFDGGASLNGGVPLAAPDPQCTAPTLGTEGFVSGGCGVGPELAVLLPLLGALRRRARKSG